MTTSIVDWIGQGACIHNWSKNVGGSIVASSSGQTNGGQ
jgi:hypothetical protein